MTPLWTGQDAQAATGGQLRGEWAVTGVSIDSREVSNGDLFVALKDQRDGHDFVAAALQAGAGAALVSYVPDGLPKDAPLLIVPDVLGALEQLAAAARNRTGAKVIAVTGSAGKTSSKEMLRVVLEKQGRTHVAQRSFNNHWGVPLTLARMPEGTEFAVVEIGMNHPGEIAPLSRLTRPDVAMITNVGAAHMEAFDDLAGIAKEKASIASGLEPEGTIVVCSDVADEALVALDEHLPAQHPKIWYGSKGADAWDVLDTTQHDECSVVSAKMGAEREIVFKVSAPGLHFALNGLGVLAAVEAAGANPIVAAHDLIGWQPPAGRGKRETVVLDIVDDDMCFELIDDAFNANPASMAASLGVLAALKPEHRPTKVARGRRIAILGDMLELGADEVELHGEIAKLKATKKLDIIHTVGPRMQHLHDALKPKRRGCHFDDVGRAIAKVGQLVEAGDIVLVKGSKGSKVSQVVDALRKLGHPAGQEG